MGGDTFPRFKAAAVQAGPVFMDREATVQKACRYIEEAGDEGARLVAFAEVFVPGYPYWARYLPPWESRLYTRELVKQAVQVPSEATERLCHAAQRAGTYAVMGINEKVPYALGTIFNTNLIISPSGRIIGHHRKLVPTYIEKLVWASGDGYGLRVLETDIGRLGTLMCGENGNTLARFALIADGEQVHVANYPAIPGQDGGGYNLAKDIEIRSAAHSFEGKIFTVTVSSVVNESVVDYFTDRPEIRDTLSTGSVGHTAIYGPHGLPIAGPMDPGVEGILYGEIDIEEIIVPKIRHDIAGSYNRFDVLSLRVNRRRNRPIVAEGDGAADGSRAVDEAARAETGMAQDGGEGSDLAAWVERGAS